MAYMQQTRTQMTPEPQGGGLAAEVAALRAEVESLKAQLAKNETEPDTSSMDLERLVPALEAAAARGVKEIPFTSRDGTTQRIPTDPDTIARLKAQMGEETPEEMGPPMDGPAEAPPAQASAPMQRAPMQRPPMQGAPRITVPGGQ